MTNFPANNDSPLKDVTFYRVVSSQHLSTGGCGLRRSFYHVVIQLVIFNICFSKSIAFRHRGHLIVDMWSCMHWCMMEMREEQNNWLREVPRDFILGICGSV